MEKVVIDFYFTHLKLALTFCKQTQKKKNVFIPEKAAKYCFHCCPDLGGRFITRGVLLSASGWPIMHFNTAMSMYTEENRTKPNYITSSPGTCYLWCLKSNNLRSGKSWNLYKIPDFLRYLGVYLNSELFMLLLEVYHTSTHILSN